MIAIGNGENCPYCDEIMEDGKILGLEAMQHLMTDHKELAMNDLFGKNAHAEGTSEKSKMIKKENINEITTCLGYRGEE